MSMTLFEDSPQIDLNLEDKNAYEILNLYIKSPIIDLGEDINLFFDQNLSNISLSPILPLSKIDILFQIYKLNISKKDLMTKIKKILNGENSKGAQTFYQNGKKVQTLHGQLKIVDEHFIKDCIILSKASSEGAFIIADRISKTLFGESIIYNYKVNEDNKKYVIAFLKYKENIYIQSDNANTDNEAKFNVNLKIIKKYLLLQDSMEIIKNINECLENKEKLKNERKAKFEKILQEMGGDRNLLRNKRKITQEEFSRRLPYFNMLEKDKNNENRNNLMSEDDTEDFFVNTEGYPIDEILLGDTNIVDNHLKDFKYTPLRIYEMIRDSEKKRGVDFKYEYSQINDKNYCVNNEVTIFSQKLGIKVQGFGKTKEEAENKCALNLITVIFRDKFKTFFELHNYFEHKNGKYLDIILLDENIDGNKNKNSKEIDDNNKEKELEEVNAEKADNKNINNIINEKRVNKELNLCKPIFINNNNNSNADNISENNNSNGVNDTHDTLENSNYNFNNLNNNGNYNIVIGFGNLFQCNTNNFSNINSNNIITCKLVDATNKNKILKSSDDNSSSSKESHKNN
jgi:hypothetical protein